MYILALLVAMSAEDPNIGLSETAVDRLEKRWLWRDSSGKLIETPYDLVKRVTRFIAQPERTETLREKWQKEFEKAMLDMTFWPGTMIISNAGKPQAQLGNCYVLPIEDSIEKIFQTLFDSSVIKKNGGGFGCNFSPLRPKGDKVGPHPGLAAGPVKILTLFDDASSIYIARGRYMGGNMAILNADHPDILEFISCKGDSSKLPFTNISVGVTNKFMRAVQQGKNWKLINPRSGKTVNEIPARTVMQLAAHYAHKNGDPGLMFLDSINKDNPMLEGMGPIDCTNVCGELPLYPHEACNLGYINLTKFILEKDERTKTKKFDEKRLREVCRVAVRFMDNTVEAASFPVEEINKTVKSLRRLGIGVTGWADCLAELEIPYDDQLALGLGENVMRIISDECHKASIELAKEKGAFAWVDKSIWARRKRQPRNVGTNTLPPSSGNSVIYNVSFSIEPYFGLAFTQHVLDGDMVQSVNETLLRKIKDYGVKIEREKLVGQIMENKGSIKGIRKIPKSLQEVFKTAYDLDYEAHIKMQAAFQKHCDNSISKTINMPNEATEEDVKDAYMLAWKLSCKGITVYRDGSKEGQVFQYNGDKK